MAAMSIVTRFAPSPTGYLHLGHAFSAWTAWRRARAAGGRFLLRLEDIDPGRCRPEYADAVRQDLAWLGLDWDGPVRVQSDHMEEYAAVLAALRDRGLTYPCFCSRADIQRQTLAAAPHGPGGEPLYPGTCRDLPDSVRAARADEPHALRLHMARAVVNGLTFREEADGIVQADPAQFGDVAIARKETPSSYHLCVTHDDALQGVTLVTRGDDLKDATHLHRLLQALMGWPVPDYAHHGLLIGADGKRLAKREKSVTLRAMRAGGATAAAVLRRLETGLNGLSQEPDAGLEK